MFPFELMWNPLSIGFSLVVAIFFSTLSYIASRSASGSKVYGIEAALRRAGLCFVVTLLVMLLMFPIFSIFFLAVVGGAR